jgi:hypothetical protein
MPQISTRPQDARKVIDAGLPKNISEADRKKLEAGWNQQAADRAAAIAAETRTPTEPSLVLVYELRKFGRHWNAYVRKNRKLIPLLPAPSLKSSAIDALIYRMEDEASAV